ETAGETDGFGKRASEEEFTSQFIGKSGPFTYGEGVDALSGATITSNAVLEALNGLLTEAE
ncbi:MAG: FMN-binding protein, partial [Clostridia bacterium]|nr:FMN-binding protein [Clostridia bacterium]